MLTLMLATVALVGTMLAVRARRRWSDDRWITANASRHRLVDVQLDQDGTIREHWTLDVPVARLR